MAKDKKANKPMFWMGIAMIVIAAISLITVEGDLGINPTIIGFLGILAIGASKYRPLK